MWDAIKKLPGTVVTVVVTLLGIVILLIMFPERAQLIAILGSCALLSVVAFRANVNAGFIITILVIFALGFWGPSLVQESKRANDPNGTFASFFAKAKEQTLNAIRTYAPGAMSQASVSTGVMSVDAKLSANLDKHLLRLGTTIDSNQLVLNDKQVNSLMSAAETIKENQKVFQNVFVAAGITSVEPVKHADTLVTLQLDVSDSDPLEFEIPAGQQVTFWVESARYAANIDAFTHQNVWTDANGYAYIATSGGPSMYPAPGLNLGALLYRPEGLGWTMTGMQAKHLVENKTGSDMTVAFIINDKSDGYEPNEGEVIIYMIMKPV